MAPRWVVGLAVCAACGHSSGNPSGDASDAGVDSSDAPADAVPPAPIDLFSASPPLARAGTTVTLEGVFAGASSVRLPGGVTAPITLLGPNRATIVVPAGATLGDLDLNSGGGHVGFHAVPYQLGLSAQFENYEETDTAREPNLLAKRLTRHGSVTIGSSVYVLGGYDGSQFLSEIERATINADGSLGAFSIVPNISLAAPRADFSVIVIDDYVYVIGGMNGVGTTTVERALIQPDHTLGTFDVVPGVTLTAARIGPTAAVVGDYVYVIGGANSAFLDTVERAQIAPGGTITTFDLVPGVTLAPDPGTARSGRMSAASAVIGNTLYVFGGADGGPYATVEASTIQPNGMIDTFSIVPNVSLQVARYGLTTTILGDYVYAIGGFSGQAGFADELERAPIQSNGTIGTFERTGLYMPQTRVSATIAIAGNYLYVVGGDTGGGGAGAVTLLRAAIDAPAELASFTPAPAIALDTAVSDQAMVTSGDRVYVLGGVTATGDYSSAVQVATVTQGKLDTFTTSATTTLATPRAGAATAVIGDYVYVIGGSTATGVVGTIERAAIAADGSLGTFEPYADSSLFTARANATAAVIDGYGGQRFLIVIGGIAANGTILGSVEYAAIGADGSLGALAIDTAGTLVTPRYRTSLAVHYEPGDGYYVYVVGGIGPSGYLADVERGHVALGGSFPANFAGFARVTGVTLSTARAGHAALVIGNTLYVIGGADATGPLASIEAAAFTGDAASPLAAFGGAGGAALATARASFACVMIANQAYAVGGETAAGASSTIEAAPLF